jgi:hypothetical protein
MIDDQIASVTRTSPTFMSFQLRNVRRAKRASAAPS